MTAGRWPVGLQKTDGSSRLRHTRLERTVGIVAHVPEVLREAQECPDLAEGADDLRPLTRKLCCTVVSAICRCQSCACYESPAPFSRFSSWSAS